MGHPDRRESPSPAPPLPLEEMARIDQEGRGVGSSSLPKLRARGADRGFDQRAGRDRAYHSSPGIVVRR
jgi:hypothetical protein